MPFSQCVARLQIDICRATVIVQPKFSTRSSRIQLLQLTNLFRKPTQRHARLTVIVLQDRA